MDELSEAAILGLITDRLEAITNCDRLTFENLNGFWPLIADITTGEIWSSAKGADLTSRVLHELANFVCKLNAHNGIQMFEESFATFTGSMCRFLVLWKSAPLHYLVKQIVVHWLNLVVASHNIRWEAIRANWTQFQTMFNILKNVGNYGIQLDLLELLMRYFFELQKYYDVLSLFQSPISNGATPKDIQMLGKFFHTMIGDVDKEAQTFLFAFNQAQPVRCVHTVVANRGYFNRKMLPVKPRATLEGHPMVFYVAFNLTQPSISFDMEMSTLGPTTTTCESDAWFPFEIFRTSIQNIRCLPKANEFALFFKFKRSIVLSGDIVCTDLLLVFDRCYLEALRENVFDVFQINQMSAVYDHNASTDTFNESTIATDNEEKAPHIADVVHIESRDTSKSLFAPVDNVYSLPPITTLPNTEEVRTETPIQQTIPGMEYSEQYFKSQPGSTQPFIYDTQSDGQNCSFQTTKYDVHTAKLPPVTTTNSNPVANCIDIQVPLPSITDENAPSDPFNATTQPLAASNKSSQKSIRCISAMRELRRRPQTPDIPISLPDAAANRCPYDQRNDLSPPPPKKRLRNTSSAQNRNPTKPPSVRANARFKNPYLMFKNNNRKLQGNIEFTPHHKGVSFSYRQNENSQLGYSTKEVSIQFGDDTPVVQQKITKRQLSTKKSQTSRSKKNSRGASKKPSATLPEKVSSKRISAKRVSVCHSNDVVMTETPDTVTVSRMDAITKIVRNTETITSTKTATKPSRTAETTSGLATDHQNDWMESDSDDVLMTANYQSSCSQTSQPNFRRHRKVPLAKSNKQTFVRMKPQNKSKQISKSKPSASPPESYHTKKAALLINGHEVAAMQISSSSESVIDVCREGNSSAPNLSIPSIGNLNSSAMSVMANKQPPSMMDYNHLQMPNMSVVIPDSPSPPPLSVETTQSICGPGHSSRIIGFRSNSSESSVENEPILRPNRSSVLTKTRPANCAAANSPKEHTIAATNRPPKPSALFPVTPKRNRQKRAVDHDADESNWILKNFMDKICLTNDESNASDQTSIESLDKKSPIRANNRRELPAWSSSSDTINSDQHNIPPNVVSLGKPIRTSILKDIKNHPRLTTLCASPLSKRFETPDHQPGRCSSDMFPSADPTPEDRLHLAKAKRRVSFAMDVVSCTTKNSHNIDSELTQLIAKQRSTLEAEQSDALTGIQAQIDDVQRSFVSLVDDGVHRIEENEEKCRETESRVEELVHTLQQLKDRYSDEMSDTRSIRSSFIERFVEINERWSAVQKAYQSELNKRNRLQMDREEGLSRNVWRAAVRKTSDSLRNVLDRLNK